MFRFYQNKLEYGGTFSISDSEEESKEDSDRSKEFDSENEDSV